MRKRKIKMTTRFMRRLAQGKKARRKTMRKDDKVGAEKREKST